MVNVGNNPTRSTIKDEFQEEEEYHPRRHHRRHCRWGKILFPIIGLVALLVIVKKCIKRRRMNMRLRQQQMMQQNAPAIVPVQRSLPEQLMYHRQEAQRIEMLMQQHQHQQHQQQQQMYEPSYEAMYGQPMQRY
jgi:flagellar biosynthesis/type III secretory pathway M-ring protein FliF/YscJ